jgi:(E)-4-hydroxy-3-methylbut-2-enyl-diphosphate synthase
VDLVRIVDGLEKKISRSGISFSKRPLRVAVMGCVVNGPGEAREADIGVAFGKKEGLVFRNGKAIKKVKASNCIDYLLSQIGG